MPPFPEAAIGPIVAALFTGLVVLFSLVISKESKISEFRQAWIDALREDLKQLTSHARSLKANKTMTYTSAKDGWEAIQPHYTAFCAAVASIRLRLNPEEPGPKEALKRLNAVVAVVNPTADDGTALGSLTNYEQLENDLVGASIPLLKGEWVRVKKGEIVFRVFKYAALAVVVAGAGALVLAGGAWIASRCG